MLLRSERDSMARRNQQAIAQERLCKAQIQVQFSKYDSWIESKEVN
jgi:hypothetical protein